VKNITMRTTIFKLTTAIAWSSIIFIIYATLTRVGFVYSIYYKLSPYLMQPEMKTYAHLEHVIAFAMLGALFSFVYPRRAIMVFCLVLGGAVVLEILQTLTPDRHGTLVDAVEKMAGGAAGILSVKVTQKLWSDRSAADQTSVG
jgi:VanZ family protein